MLIENILTANVGIKNFNPFLPQGAIRVPFSNNCINEAVMFRLEPYEVPNIGRG